MYLSALVMTGTQYGFGLQDMKAITADGYYFAMVRPGTATTLDLYLYSNSTYSVINTYIFPITDLYSPSAIRIYQDDNMSYHIIIRGHSSGGFFTIRKLSISSNHTMVSQYSLVQGLPFVMRNFCHTKDSHTWMELGQLQRLIFLEFNATNLTYTTTYS
jgi:hypothetical protein